MRDLSVSPPVRTRLKIDANLAGQVSGLIVELLQLILVQTRLPQSFQLFTIYQPRGRLRERLPQSRPDLFMPKVRMTAIDILWQFLRAPLPFLKPFFEPLPERLFRVD